LLYDAINWISILVCAGACFFVFVSSEELEVCCSEATGTSTTTVGASRRFGHLPVMLAVAQAVGKQSGRSYCLDYSCRWHDLARRDRLLSDCIGPWQEYAYQVRVVLMLTLVHGRCFMWARRTP
jgi:hypothetical protein